MDVAGILMIAVCGAIGIYIRYEARETLGAENVVVK